MPVRCTEARFVLEAPRWPPSGLNPLPQVCFCGRSNVGKSSLLNTVVNRRNLARTSSTPGRTQALMVFEVAFAHEGTTERANFVDLPGYGYAKAPEEVRGKWRGMMNAYFRDNDRLRAAVLLLDIRRDPATEELELLETLAKYGVPSLLVVTKIDKVGTSKRVKEFKRIAEGLGLEDWHDLRPVSVLERTGIDDLMGDIWTVLRAGASGEAIEGAQLQ